MQKNQWTSCWIHNENRCLHLIRDLSLDYLRFEEKWDLRFEIWLKDLHYLLWICRGLVVQLVVWLVVLNDFRFDNEIWFGICPWLTSTVRLCNFCHISTTDFGVRASRASFVALFAISCTRYRVSRPLRSRVTLNNARRRYFRFCRNRK